MKRFINIFHINMATHPTIGTFPGRTTLHVQSGTLALHCTLEPDAGTS